MKKAEDHILPSNILHKADTHEILQYWISKLNILFPSYPTQGTWALIEKLCQSTKVNLNS